MIKKKIFFLFLILFLIPNFSFSSSLKKNENSSHGNFSFNLPGFSFNLSNKENPKDTVSILKILVILTVLSLAPSIIIMTTSFTRIVIVLSFIRQALGTHQMPPNQLIIGLSLFLSFFIMSPTFKLISDRAIEPYLNEKIDQKTAFYLAELPLRDFMLKQTREKDLELLLSISKERKPYQKSEVPTYVLIPSFIMSELKTAFQIGFMIYLPFLVLDMVIASVLMAMGMMMLPPVMIALPFKILLFVLVDGWELIIGSLVKSFG